LPEKYNAMIAISSYTTCWTALFITETNVPERNIIAKKQR